MSDLGGKGIGGEGFMDLPSITVTQEKSTVRIGLNDLPDR
jgi:hypothetical protein